MASAMPARTSKPPRASRCLFVARRRRSAQSAHAVDDAVAVGMADRFDQVPPLATVIAVGLGCGAYRQVPFDAIAFTTC